MKRIFALLISALLALSALPTIVFAEGTLDSIDTTVAPFVDAGSQVQTVLTDANVTDSKVISLTLNPALFKAGGENLGVSDMVVADFAKLRVVEASDTTKQTELESRFTASFRFDNDAAPPAVILNLTAKNGAKDTDFSYLLGVGYTSDGTTVSLKTNTSPVVFSGTLKAKNGSISGFANANSLVVNGGNSTGGSTWNSNTLNLPYAPSQVVLEIPLPDNLFSYIGSSDSTLTTQKLNDYGFAIDSGATDGLVAALDTVNKKVTATVASPVTQSYSFKLKGKNSLNQDISKTVTIDIAVAGPSITSIEQKSGPAPTLNDTSKIESIGNGLSKLALGQSVTVKVPVDNFTITATGDEGDDVNKVVAYLNNNHKSWVSASNLSGVDIDYIAIGSDVGIRITPKSAGTFINPGITFNGTSLKLADKLVIYNGSGSPVYLGIANTAALSPSVSNSAMTVGDTVTYVLEGNRFNWSHGSAQSSFASALNSNLNVSGLPSNFSYAFVYDSGLKKTVLRLTATGSGNISAGSFKLTDKSALVPNPETITLSYPKITITSPISAVGNKITGISDSAYLGENVTLDGSGYSGDIGDLYVGAGSVMYLDFDSDFFVWDKGNPNPAVNVTSAMLSSGRITVRMTKRSGGDAIKDASIVTENGRARVKVEFVKTFNSLKSKSFGATIYLQVSGSRHTGSQIEIGGVLENEVQYAYSGETYYDLTDNPVLEAQDTIRNAELYVGNDTYIHATLTKNRSYYAATVIDYTNADLLAFDRNSSIEEIVHMETKNIPDTAKVSFNTAYRYYVYNAEGKYLGTTADKVGLSSTYYFSTKRASLSLGSITSIVEEESSAGSASGGASSTPDTPPIAPPSNEPPQNSGGQTGGSVSSEASWDYTSYNPPNGAAPSSPGTFIALTALLLAGCLALTGRKER